jgi:hypothetical protein
MHDILEFLYKFPLILSLAWPEAAEREKHEN